MNKLNAMTFVFQHLATSKFTKDGKSCLTLYGRTASGESAAIHVYDIKPYGYIKADLQWWYSHKDYLSGYLSWIMAADRLSWAENSDFNQKNLKEQILGENGWLEKAKETAMKVESIDGYNIRNVHEKSPDKFLRIQTDNGNILRQIIKCIKTPDKAKDIILDCRKKLRSLKISNPKKHPDESYERWLQRVELKKEEYKIPEMPPSLPDSIKEVYETHVGEDLVWMVDNHLQACGWMEVVETFRTMIEQYVQLTLMLTVITKINQ